MKKLLLGFAVVVTLLLTACGGNDYELIDVASYTHEELAEMYLDDLMNEEYDKAYQHYPHDSAMKNAVNGNAYKAIMEDLYRLYGDIQEVEEYIVSEVDGYTIISFPTKLESENLNLNVVLDGEKNIAGFNIGEYSN